MMEFEKVFIITSTLLAKTYNLFGQLCCDSIFSMTEFMALSMLLTYIQLPFLKDVCLFFPQIPQMSIFMDSIASILTIMTLGAKAQVREISRKQ